ncbi:SusC/RagA family TonB-linked outer membrane protein [Winogradskyella flava]|uniref:TonB-dependent receptor n=1 Tax=Winogradskyella flava TaxID=1884876 RepID=A0A842J003_9FLAO|nr:TonB-dependent receptor [Winogradskyella flava]MBC2846308.1 TonB-dependent receptor [Winogradskyella flava]
MKINFFTLFAVFFSMAVFGQTVDVTGTVIEASSGQPLPGVNVLLKNTAKGTSTDFDGNFKLNEVPINSVIVISYIGFITQEITIKSSEPINVSLQEDAESLSEIVVIGYGTQKKKESTGAVSVLDTEAIEKLNPQRVEQALQGQIAGVNVTSTSGSPGAGANIRIRGVSTNGDSRPLILVDGNVIEDLSVLNPNDIKSINVLKDATAGIYGVRGANGVVLITTKTGRKASELKYSVDVYSGFQTTSQKIDVLGPRDYAIYVNDALGETVFFEYPQTGTDWQDEVFQTAAISDINFSVSGGGEKSAYSFGVSNLDQDGIVGAGKSNYRRSTARFSYQYDILDNLKLSSTGIYTNSKKNNLGENGIGAPLYNAVNINPNLAIFDIDGNFTSPTSVDAIEIVNPLAQIANTHNITTIDRYSATLGLDYTFFEKFTVSSKLQINYANVLDDIFRPVIDFGNNFSKSGSVRPVSIETDDNGQFVSSSGGNEIVDNSAFFTDYTFDGYITYEDTFNEDHNLTVLLGGSAFRTRGRFYGQTGFVLANDSNSVDDAFADGSVANKIDPVTGRLVPRFREDQLENGADMFDVRLQSFFTRVQYNYKGKYLFSAVLRRDGSSRFGPNNKFGYFPSGSIGWNVSDEDFLSNSNTINFLKLRASYGIIGNDRIPDFRFITLLDNEGSVAPGNAITQTDILLGVAPGVPGNPNLKWEEQETLNVGFDARFFDNKVSLTVDAFRKQTNDLLFDPQASGLINTSLSPTVFPTINAGTVVNKGIEFSIAYNNSFSEDIDFNIGFNLTTLENEVTSVNGNIPPTTGEFGVGINQINISRMVPGFSLGHYFGYETNGVYQTQAEIDALNANAADNDGVFHTGAEVGDLKFVDRNGNGYIDEDDRTVIGEPIPDVTMGFNIGFRYKNIDFSANAFASIGNDMVRDYERKIPTANIGTFALDRWQGTGTSNSTPSFANGSVSTNTFSDFYVEDASFLRLQNVQIGLTFGEKTVSSLGVDKLRIYLSGNNLFTITDYSGYDPSASTGSPLAGTIDKGFYPVAKSYLVGVNLNF